MPTTPNSQAYMYITRALKTFAPHVLGAMQLVAESYDPQELDRVGLHLYVSCLPPRSPELTVQGQFKPDVTGWGQRGTLSVANILETMKDKVEASEGAPDGGAEQKGSAPHAEESADLSEPPIKRPKLEAAEYENPAEGAEDAKSDVLKSPQGGEDQGSRPEGGSGPGKPAMTVEEYEAMLDAEAGDWDFPEGV